jgi:xanthine dehydrogenase YagR molybdenum-binding subunit
VWGQRSIGEHGRHRASSRHRYHVAACADVHAIEAAWIDEHDEEVNPIGAKGIGEIGIVGTAAAIANAVFHATGVRFRELPIHLDRLVGAGGRLR